MNDKIMEIEGVKYRLVPIDGGISNLSVGDKKVALSAEVQLNWGLNVFTRADGSEGRVHSLLVSDNTGSIKVALWEDHAKAVENIQVGDTIIISNGYVKQGQEKKDNNGKVIGHFSEIHVGKYSTVTVVTKEEQSQL